MNLIGFGGDCYRYAILLWIKYGGDFYVIWESSEIYEVNSPQHIMIYHSGVYLDANGSIIEKEKYNYCFKLDSINPYFEKTTLKQVFRWMVLRNQWFFYQYQMNTKSDFLTWLNQIDNRLQDHGRNSEGYFLLPFEEICDIAKRRKKK